jgi:hypothetical protein
MIVSAETMIVFAQDMIVFARDMIVFAGTMIGSVPDMTVFARDMIVKLTGMVMAARSLHGSAGNPLGGCRRLVGRIPGCNASVVGILGRIAVTANDASSTGRGIPWFHRPAAGNPALGPSRVALHPETSETMHCVRRKGVISALRRRGKRSDAGQGELHKSTQRCRSAMPASRTPSFPRLRILSKVAPDEPCSA